jgi:hypothetical protein
MNKILKKAGTFAVVMFAFVGALTITGGVKQEAPEPEVIEVIKYVEVQKMPTLEEFTEMSITEGEVGIQAPVDQSRTNVEVTYTDVLGDTLIVDLSFKRMSTNSGVDTTYIQRRVDYVTEISYPIEAEFDKTFTDQQLVDLYVTRQTGTLVSWIYE